MTEALLKKINDPTIKWIVYLYVIPHYPHEMYYVGLSSNDIDVRLGYWYGHNTELIDAIREAGGMKNVGVYILCETPDFWKANYLEKYYISYYHSLYDPYSPDGGYGYNKQDGGLFGYTVCQYSKDLNSKAHNKPVAQLSKYENKIIAIYASLRIAAQITGIPWKQISAVLCDLQHTAGGYRWISLKPYLSKEQIEKIFYSKDASDVIIPLDPIILYSDIKTKSKAKKSQQAAGAIPAAVLVDEERKI